MLTILKLGGALLTDKARPNSLRTDLLARVAREIREAMDAGLIDDLLLVHGVGAYGHLPVLQHNLHKGLQSPEQLLALSQTQSQVMRLRSAIIAALQQVAIPAVLMLPSSCMTARHFRGQGHYDDAIAGFLRIGMTPVLGGDVLADETAGFSVYGGDAIGVDMALRFRASRLLFATDVDGVYDADPRENPAARRIPQLHLSQMSAVTLSTRELDVSGAMAGKLHEIERASAAMNQGLKVHLFSMMTAGQLRDVLLGEDVGTEVMI